MSVAPVRGKVIVSGILFWYPLAGVTFQFLHYMEGLRRLGYDVWYVEDSGRWIYDPALNDLSAATPSLTRVFDVLNYALNELAYNPPGPQEEGYLFWASWANHAGNSIFGGFTLTAFHTACAAAAGPGASPARQPSGRA